MLPQVKERAYGQIFSFCLERMRKESFCLFTFFSWWNHCLYYLLPSSVYRFMSAPKESDNSCEIINCYSLRTNYFSCDSLGGARLLMPTSQESLLIWVAGSEMIQGSRYSEMIRGCASAYEIIHLLSLFPERNQKALLNSANIRNGRVSYHDHAPGPF